MMGVKYNSQHHYPSMFLVEGYRYLFKLIVKQFGGCLKEKGLDSIYTNLTLCRLFKERHDLLGKKMLGPNDIETTRQVIKLIQFINKALTEELKARGISDNEIERKIREELSKIKIIIRI